MSDGCDRSSPLVVLAEAIFVAVAVGLAAWAVHETMERIDPFHLSPEVRRPAAEGATAYYAPGDGPERAVVGLIGSARLSVRVMAYNFTSRPIAAALAAARARGVDVECVVDRSMPRERGSVLGTLLAAGVPVLVDGRHPIMHDKLCLVDGAATATGSYNYSAAAVRNAENLAIVPGAALAAAYRRHYDDHRGHSVPAGALAAARFIR